MGDISLTSLEPLFPFSPARVTASYLLLASIPTLPLVHARGGHKRRERNSLFLLCARLHLSGSLFRTGV